MLHSAEEVGDRQAIRERLVATRQGFYALVETLTDDDLRLQSGNPAWTVRAVLTHLVWSLELLPREVASAQRGRGMFNFPPLVRDLLNEWLTRAAARGQSLERLRRRYDAAFDTALTTFDALSDNELHLGARFWSEGFRTISALYAAQADHLAEHGPDVRSAVSRELRIQSSGESDRTHAHVRS